MRPSPEQLLAEAAELASHFHWSLDVILDLEHKDRQLFLDHVRASAVAVAAAEWSE
jgi:hypothetical protein